MSSQHLKPFIKWAGGKGQILSEIEQRYPQGLGICFTKYAEPFIGGGAVLFSILEKYDMKSVYISDINAELINAYIQIRDDVNDVISLLQNYENYYIPADESVRKEFYYLKRDEYNSLKRKGVRTPELAALFIFLNRTCFNGLYRVNKKGDFNVPMGSYKNPTICDSENLRNVSKALKKVTIECALYSESESFIDRNTFAYFDPPYRPLNATSNFTSYTENDFDDNAQTELAKYIISLSNRGAYVIASNSDPKNTDANDCFFDELYAPLEIERIFANRMINSNASSRGKITELLIHNKEIQ